ncbi:MAG: hypothetical protein ACYCSB_10435 [bacterium]
MAKNDRSFIYRRSQYRHYDRNRRHRDLTEEYKKILEYLCRIKV